jgi:hypothetical protein
MKEFYGAWREMELLNESANAAHEKGSGRRQISKARVEITVRSKEGIGLSGAWIARHLGVNTSSINRALAKRERL